MVDLLFVLWFAIFVHLSRPDSANSFRAAGKALNAVCACRCFRAVAKHKSFRTGLGPISDRGSSWSQQVPCGKQTTTMFKLIEVMDSDELGICKVNSCLQYLPHGNTYNLQQLQLKSLCYVCNVVFTISWRSLPR